MTHSTRTSPPDPSLRRSLALFRTFLREQQDPEACYSLLARDAADQVEAVCGGVAGKVVVDVGGGSGYFTREFRRRGAHGFLFEPDAQELGARPAAPAVVADGYLLPLAEGAADVTFSSNVLEHVDDPQTFLSELVRVTPAGRARLSLVHQLAVPVGRSRVGALALPGRRPGPRPLSAAHGQAPQAHARREPLRASHRPDAAPGQGP